MQTVFGVYRYGSLNRMKKFYHLMKLLCCYEFDEVLNVEVCDEEANMLLN